MNMLGWMYMITLASAAYVHVEVPSDQVNQDNGCKGSWVKLWASKPRKTQVNRKYSTYKGPIILK